MRRVLVDSFLGGVALAVVIIRAVTVRERQRDETRLPTWADDGWGKP